MGEAGKTWDIGQRAFEFAVRVVRLCRELDKQSGAVRRLSGQLFDAATSIGANIEEGQTAQSHADFIHKYKIALKEARETKYWPRLLVASELMQQSRVADLAREASELAAILGRCVVTATSKR